MYSSLEMLQYAYLIHICLDTVYNFNTARLRATSRIGKGRPIHLKWHRMWQHKSNQLEPTYKKKTLKSLQKLNLN